jgi:hypothetical protein
VNSRAFRRGSSISLSVARVSYFLSGLGGARKGRESQGLRRRYVFSCESDREYSFHSARSDGCSPGGCADVDSGAVGGDATNFRED